MVDPAGAVALHVAVAADRAGAGALAADVAAQEQQKIDDLAHGVDAVLVLGDAQAPGDDDPLRGQVGVCELADFGLGDCPIRRPGPTTASRPTSASVLVEAVGVVLDELSVQAAAGSLFGRLQAPLWRRRAAVPCPRRSVLGSSWCRSLVVWNVAMSTNSCGTMVRREPASMSGLMWTSCAPRRSASASQVSIRGALVAALSPITQMASAASQSCRSTVPLPVPSAGGQRPAAGLVAHVRAVGQIVGAELAYPQLVEEGRLVAEPPRGVKRRLMRAVQGRGGCRRPGRTRPPRRSARTCRSTGL